MSEHKDYQPMIAKLNAKVQAKQGKELGDPKLGVERMIDVIKSEGMAEGRLMPGRLPLGTDALNIVRAKCLETLKICDEWESVIQSTDFADKDAVGAIPASN